MESEKFLALEKVGVGYARKNKKNSGISKCHLLKFLPSMHSIINTNSCTDNRNKIESIYH